MKEKNTVLIVDDTPDNISVLRSLLKNDYQIKIATSGPKALSIAFADQPPDLILLDIMMPEMDGYEVCRAIKKSNRTQGIPIIFITAKTEAQDIVKGFEVGGIDYITKPFNAPELFARVSTHLNLFNMQRKNQLLIDEMQKELNNAARYVQSLLPAPIAEANFKIDWRFLPCESLGGDAFGYHWLDEDHFALYLLDVSGHGVGAALLSVSVMNVLRAQTLANVDFRDPAQVLTALNRTFPGEEHNDMFFTAWYGVYNKQSRQLTYASAGHPPALLLTGNGSEKYEMIQLRTANNIIGGIPDTTYTKGNRQISNPSCLYIFSDGVYEIEKADGSFWRFDEFAEFMQQPNRQPRSDMDRLFEHARTLKRSESFDDDFTIMEVIFGD